MTQTDPFGIDHPRSPARYCLRLAVFARRAWHNLSDHDKQKFTPDSSDLDIARALYDDPPLQSCLSALTQYTPSKWLLEEELIARGKFQPGTDVDAYAVAALPKNRSTGLCISGGGIRSATFALGVLQGLSRAKLLDKFDYLSSVSGGGYVHQFLAAWIKQKGDIEEVQRSMEPLPNQPALDSYGNVIAAPTRPYATVQPGPIRWLRRYSNYLTPQRGAFSADTWTMVAIWSRNTFLNQLVLAAALIFLLLLPHIPVSSTVAHLIRDDYDVTNSPTTVKYLVLLLMLVSIGALGLFLWPTVSFATTKRASVLTEPAETHPGSGRTKIISWILGPLILAIALATPSVYRSLLPSVHYVHNHHFTPDLTGNKADLRLAFSKDSDDESEYVFKTLGHIGHRLHILPDKWTPSTPFQRPTIGLWFALLSSAGFTIALLVALPRIRLRGTVARKAPLVLILLLLVVVASVGVFLLYLARRVLFESLFFVPEDMRLSFVTVFLPLLLLAVPFISLEIAVGLIGRELDGAQREWLARLRAFSFLAGILWLGFGGFSLLGPSLFRHIVESFPRGKFAAIGTWLATTIAGVLTGKSEKTTGQPKGTKSVSAIIMEIITLVAPWVFIAGLLLLLAQFIHVLFHLAGKHTGALPSLPLIGILMFIAATIVGLLGWRLDINEFSLHPFYRDRLARCYGGAATPNRMPDRFTGFTGTDRQYKLPDLLPVKFGGQYLGPFPIFCTAINLTSGEDLAYQERKAASFTFTPLYSGYNVGWTESNSRTRQFNGFIHNDEYVYSGLGGMNMAGAVAISGAAVSPNMGYHTNPAVAFLLTVFNVRLGWWIRNPRYQFKSDNPTNSPIFGLLQLLNELLGSASDTAKFVYLTDGGHFDNMGLYELVRRRCRTIVICDGEQDCKLQFGGLGMAIRKCRLDFGVEVNLDDVRHMSCYPALNKHHVVTGQVIYPEDPSNPGTVVYIKSSLTGDEPADLLNYRHEDPVFPHDSTANQFFTESKFESYRALGVHIATNPAFVTQLERLLN
jgi:hypothetical protein